MEVIQSQVIVVGAGCAGLRAAVQMATSDPEARIVCLSKHPTLHAGGAGGGGGAAGGLDDAELDQHARETVVAGGFLCDQDAVDAFVAQAPQELAQMEQWGCAWRRAPEGRIHRRRMTGMRTPLAWHVADRTVPAMRRTLWQQAQRHGSIEWLSEHFVSKLLIADRRIAGVAALNIRTGQVKAVLAPAVVLASGGAGGLYPVCSGGSGQTGDGLALAYREGVPLRDVEFVQHHPLGASPSGEVVSEAILGEGARLRDAEQHVLLDGRRRPLPARDRIARAMQRAQLDGRALSEDGALELDLRTLELSTLIQEFPTLCALAERQRRGAARQAVFQVRPVAHALAGGLAAELDTATALPGLFVAGDAAGLGIHGAAPLASNAASAALVTGTRAGAAALQFARRAGPAPRASLVEQAGSEAARIDRLRAHKRGESTVQLRRELGRVMSQHCSVFREVRGLQTAQGEIRSLKARHATLALADRGHVFNVELLAALELENLLDVAEAVTAAALERRESRGAHGRTDHRRRDDAGHLRHLLVYSEPGGPRVESRPVALKRWRPERSA